MPIVDKNRLKGNYGEAYVATLLSAECLVRLVAQGTDVGIDLYCESLKEEEPEQDEDKNKRKVPFLHFWVQVKTGKKCKVNGDESAASYPFKVDDLKYWARQPVPVFAALVPGDWPPEEVDHPVYIVDLTSRLLEEDSWGRQGTKTLSSSIKWEAGNREDVRGFLSREMPDTWARLLIRYGMVGQVPTPHPQYIEEAPSVPVSKYQRKILDQVRRTAALSILFLHFAKELGEDNETFRRTLARILEQFEGDLHWETYLARALSCHADGQFDQAVQLYRSAEAIIIGDPKFASKARHLDSYLTLIADLRKRAEQEKSVFA